MQLISLKNFKSYETQLLHNLNPRINIIIGQNGQGKSNFFKAILFALSDKVHHNRNEYNSNLHRAVDSDIQPIAVEILIRSNNGNTRDSNLFKMERIWNSQQDEVLKVEDKVFSKGDYESFVESLGFSFSNSYNILQQGKVNQVILMDEFEVFKLLEEATSMKKYDRRYEEAMSYIKKNDQQKKEIKEMMKEIDTRLDLYQSRREQFQMYNFEEKANKVKNKAEYQYLLRKYGNQIKQFREKDDLTSNEISKTKLKIKEHHDRLEEIVSDIRVNQKQMYEHYDDQSTMDDEGFNMSVTLTQDERDIKSKMKNVKKEKEELRKKLEKIVKDNEVFDKEMKPFKDKYEYMTSLISAEKFTKDNKGNGKDQLKSQLQKKKQNLKEIQMEINKMGKLKSEFKTKSQKPDTELLNRKRDQLSLKNNEIKANKIQYFESNRHKNHFESQVHVFTEQIQVNYAKMRRSLPLLQFNLLNQLRKQKIDGVYGFLIQFLQIEPSVLFAYEMSGLNKLCTLLVQNQRVIETVVNVNRKIKGKQINILPLSFVEKQPLIKKKLPSGVTDCFPLLTEEWIKVRPHNYGDNFTKNITKIVASTFNNHLLVKDYDLGLQVSKKYFYNCITADKQIVYSEGYLCKVGRDTNVDDRLESFFKYASKNTELLQASGKLEKVLKKLNVFQNSEMQLTKDRIGLENEIRNLQMNMDVINEQKKSVDKLQQEQKRLAERKQKCQKQISQKEDILNNIDKKNNIKVNIQEYAQLQRTYKEKIKQYNQRSQKEYEIQTRLQKVVKQEEQMDESMQNISCEISFQKDFNVTAFKGTKEFKMGLERSGQELEDKKKGIERELQNLQEKLATVQNENYVCLGNLSILEDQILFYSEKLQDLGELDMTMQDVEDRSNNYSISHSRIDQRKKVRIFTAFERLNFSKIQAWHQKYKQNQKKLTEMEELEKQIIDVIKGFQKEKDQCLGNVFKDFEKYFSEIFEAITLTGKTDVRLKRINQKVRGVIKSRNSISIMVSFEGEKEMIKKWGQFSGGQKTVIAVCLLMALQKCQPAPLYVLDEIDSALDPVYLDRIISLIEHQSQNSQYFISSFKPAMLAFPQSMCNYYLVQSHNRISQIRRINKTEAQQKLQTIMQA